ncbi:MAG: NTP transferase domain-containing protein [Chloroflexi bacterium]|nr:NTP transferase domain-containing protein [Chloroflexota bacterium]
MGGVLALVLAGGRGKRMDILCYGRPKPALPFAGRYRIIDFCLSNCLSSGVEDIAVLIDYQRSSMADYLRRWRQANSGLADLDILVPEAGSYAGTADAVFQNLEYLQKHEADTVLILAADHVYEMDYQRMFDSHERKSSEVTIGAVTVPIEQAHRFGLLSADTTGRVQSFVEKPRLPQSNMASMGIYVFNKKVLCELLSQDAARQDSAHDFGYSIIPAAIGRNIVSAFRFDGYWQDIGTVEAYYEANIDLIRFRPPFSLGGIRSIPVENGGLPLVDTFQMGAVDNSLVSAGCIIKGRVENSVLSEGVWVDEGAVITNSVLMANTFVGSRSTVDSCIIDEGVNVGKFCQVGFGAALIPGNWEVTVVGSETVIPPYVTIGRNCRVLPHVKPGDFPSRFVPSGSVIAPRSSSDSSQMQQMD